MSSAITRRPVDISRGVNRKWLDGRAWQAIDHAAELPIGDPNETILENYSLCCRLNMEVLERTQEIEDSGNPEIAAIAEGEWIAEHMVIGLLIAQGRWEEAKRKVSAMLYEMDQHDRRLKAQRMNKHPG